MSKILAELLKAANIDDQGKREDRQVFLQRVVKAVNEVDQETWDKLSDPAQDWFNDAVDAKKKDKDIADFPDIEAAPEEGRRSRSRASDDDGKKDSPAAAEVKPEDLEEGQLVEITNKRGEVIAGEVIEVSKRKEYVVIKLPAGDEKELDFDKCSKCLLMPTGGTGSGEEEGIPADPAEGDEVELVNSRDKTFTGIVTAISDDEITIDCGTAKKPDLEDFKRDRVKSVKILKAASAGKKDTGRGRSKADEKDGKDDKGGDTEKKRSTNAPGVSVGQRIRELMCDELGISEEKVGAALDKDKIEYRPPTLRMIYKDTQAVIDLLVKNKHMKAAKG